MKDLTVSHRHNHEVAGLLLYRSMEFFSVVNLCSLVMENVKQKTFVLSDNKPVLIMVYGTMSVRKVTDGVRKEENLRTPGADFLLFYFFLFFTPPILPRHMI